MSGDLRPSGADSPFAAAAVPSRAALERDIRERLFTPAPRSEPSAERPASIGAEVELLAVDAETKLGAPIEDEAGRRGTLAVVRAVAAELGWREESTASRPHAFRGPAGDALSWEPGGQLELSTRPETSITALARDVGDICARLRARAADHGIELAARGVDPWNALAATPRRLHTPRYEAMAAYFRALGTAGETMMRQTAATQLNVDFAGDRARQWRVLNASAPVMVAIFANSPRHAGEETGDRSHRAALWRALDPSRTGLPGGAGDDPSAGYLDFALDAGVMLRTDDEGGYRPMREWLARGTVTDLDWRTHLTTLFPEVRPRGFLELRSCDAVEPGWVIAPLALAAGLALHPPTTRRADELLGAPDAALLERAGRCALRDPVLARLACDLVTLALDGCVALGHAVISPADVERARDWFARYTLRGRSPADDAPDPIPAADAVA